MADPRRIDYHNESGKPDDIIFTESKTQDGKKVYTLNIKYQDNGYFFCLDEVSFSVLKEEINKL